MFCGVTTVYMYAFMFVMMIGVSCFSFDWRHRVRFLRCSTSLAPSSNSLFIILNIHADQCRVWRENCSRWAAYNVRIEITFDTQARTQCPTCTGRGRDTKKNVREIFNIRTWTPPHQRQRWPHSQNNRRQGQSHVHTRTFCVYARCGGSSMCSTHAAFSDVIGTGSEQTTPLFSMPHALNSTCARSSRICLRQYFVNGMPRSPHLTPPSEYTQRFGGLKPTPYNVFGPPKPTPAAVPLCIDEPAAACRRSAALYCRTASTPCFFRY